MMYYSVNALVLDHPLLAHVKTRLTGPLVAAGLQTNDTLPARPQVLLRPLAVLALSHLRTHLGTSVVGLVRCLRRNITHQLLVTIH